MTLVSTLYVDKLSTSPPPPAAADDDEDDDAASGKSCVLLVNSHASTEHVRDKPTCSVNQQMIHCDTATAV